jgi:phosphoribosyl-ATP pyrophosphohydrolase
MSDDADTADGSEAVAADASEAVVDAEGGDTDDPEAVLDSLFATIKQRQEELPEDSYTASLFTHEKGENEVLEKLGEEATEVILAAKDDDLDDLQYESADFVYHLLVLFAMKDLTVDDLRDELESRF